MSYRYNSLQTNPAQAGRRQWQSRHWLQSILASSLFMLSLSPAVASAADEFNVHEATIDDIQNAIQNGATNCQGVVQAYIDRVKAYNGVCTALVTEDGGQIAAATGAIRGGAAIAFPLNTVPASRYLPDLDQYEGLPLDLGRMEPTLSDPSVVQQYGMVTGIPNAGQVNALETINIRGERSVTCKGEFDAHPSTGPLPANAPAACEKFRQLPDALERAAELDAEYGSAPDLAKLPMYCATISVKDWYDVKDMRSTGGNDVNFAMDAPPDDSTVVAELRNKGAIILSVTIAAEVNFSGDGPNSPARSFVGGGGSIRSSWAGHVCNPYDTERSAGPSSGGAGVSVSANFATCAICETTGGSCREPASQNAAPSFVTTKGLTSEDGTMTARFINHRPGAICKTIGDSARVIDAIRNPVLDYFDSKDVFTALPQALVSTEPYSTFVVDDEQLQSNDKPLQGMRIGIVREYMVKHTPNDGAVSDRVDQEIKDVLRDKLGAEIVESVDPMYPDDSGVPNMTYTFQDALAEVLPFAAPEYFLQMEGDEPEFAVPGYDVRTNDYLLKLAMGIAPLSPKLNMRRILSGLGESNVTNFSAEKYLMERGDSRITDIASYAANSKWRADSQATGVQNAGMASLQDILSVDGIDRIKMQYVFRLAILKVMHENQIDAFVHPSVGVPQWKIGIDREPTIDGRLAAGPSVTDLLGVPELTIPAGFNQIVYEPRYVLNDDKNDYTLVTGDTQSMMAQPMPFSINFWAGPGDEPTLVKAASAYEVATKHRVPPAAFGAL
jgi:Asp-tRNA(Asn)/Glu-tRNA(Gln) amidotransferase A subunit family amidase